MNPLLIRRRGMMQAGGGGLPYDAKIEYLQGDGNQYINTKHSSYEHNRYDN